MNMKIVFIFGLVTLHQTLFCHEPKEYRSPLILSDTDIAFIMKNPQTKLACIPEIVRQTFVMLRDFVPEEEFDTQLIEFMKAIDQKSCIVTHEIALKSIFSALRLLKKHEYEFPGEYLRSYCQMLYDYQRSLHKEEYVQSGE